MRGSLGTIQNYCFGKASIAPLVVFRILFGGLLLYSTVRTIQKGWVEELYIIPSYHFTFFDWIQPLGPTGMYVIFIILSIAALFIILGLFYRISAATYCILFTYIELIDKTYYLNHYYLVTLLTFWLVLIPAHRLYSLDTLLFPKIRSEVCFNWHIAIIKIQLSIVYFFAGLAKVNPDWLFQAQPMATWLPGKYELPILGRWMHLKETAFVFSWAGCIYDLFIWIFLWMRKSRGVAYVFVLGFHILTGILFPRIGMFPLIMITSTIIFFSEEWHKKALSYLPKFNLSTGSKELVKPKQMGIITYALVLYVGIQLFLPFRYLQFPGNLFWHEQGYRFSWRVMLMEKNGYTSIILYDPKEKARKEVDQDLYLTPFQKQQMRSQPDMILQFANHVGDEFKKVNNYAPEVYVKSRISLNGRRSQEFTNEKVNIYGQTHLKTNNWIIPLQRK